MGKPMGRCARLLVLVGLIAAFGATPLAVWAQFAVGWSPPQMISDTGVELYVEYSELVADPSGRLHAFWEATEDDLALQNFAIYYSYLDPGGVWAQPLDIVANGRWPVVRIDSQGFMHLFVSTSECLLYTVSHVSEAYDAKSWLPSQECIGPRQLSQFDVFHGEDDSLHVIYVSDLVSVQYIYSTDGGLTWSIPSTAAAADNQSLALTETAITRDETGRLHVSWTSYPRAEAFPPLGVWYVSSDNGEVWTPPQVLANEYNLQPQLLTVDDRLDVIWNGALALSERYHRFSLDGGSTWSPSVAWVSVAGGILGHPDAAVDAAGIIHAVAGTDNGAWYATFNGDTWAPAQQIYQPEFHTGNPNVAIVLGNELHVIFRSFTDSVWHTVKQLPTEWQSPQPYPNYESSDAQAATEPVVTAPGNGESGIAAASTPAPAPLEINRAAPSRSLGPVVSILAAAIAALAVAGSAFAVRLIGRNR